MIRWLKQLFRALLLFDTSAVVYTLMNPIGSKVFNFSKFTNSFEVMTLLDDNYTLPCGD